MISQFWCKSPVC